MVTAYCKNPNEFSKLSRALRKLEGVKDCLEDDVRLSMRHLTDNNMVPCGCHQTGLG